MNFTIDRPEEITTDNGWQLDNHCIVLPHEPPGPPVPGGSWETACRLLADYKFADPSIVRAFYRANQPLLGRTMLIEGRFYWMRFLLGVRITEVTDETRSVAGHPTRIWGWSYQTLQGHLEAGQMDYEVRKRLDTGDVTFHISAFSKAASIPNPIVRLGFHTFGRHMQRKFIRHALTRTERMVRTSLPSPTPARTR